MNAITRDEALALSLPERAAVALGAAEHEVKLRELVQQSAAIVAVTNKAGREECHSAYMKLKTTRVNIGHKVNEVTEDAKLFTKAVKTEAERLVGIMVAEEDRLQALRDTWDEAEQARKDALIAAERVRVEGIETSIGNIASAPVRHIASDAAKLATAIQFYEIMPIAELEYAEFMAKAEATRADTLEKLRDMHAKALAAEQAAAAAEAARLAEIERIAAERAELAKLRAEADERERVAKAEAARVAAEQAAEAKRLAALAAEQAAELQKLRDAEAARQRAEQAERDRVAAETKRQLDAQQAEIAAERRALDEQRAAAAKAEQDRAVQQAAAMRLADDHAEAIPINAQFDADREAERVRLQALADEALAAGRERQNDEHVAGLPAGALGVDSMADLAITDEADDEEIITMVAAAFNFSILEAVDRLSRIDFDAARTLAEAA
jgi:hypothetical protein